MTGGLGGARRETIEALSARAELGAIVRVAMAIVVAVWMYVASAAGLGSGVTAQRNLLPFQKLIADRAPEEQRVFRELQEGLLEAEAARSTTGSWPTPESLAASGVPPFAIDPTQRAPYEWTLLQNGPSVNYLGRRKGGDGSAWLLLIQEPVPGVPPDQTFEDEEHHRLGDGAMLHVSTWVRADGRAVSGRVERMPQADGWTQLYAVGPAAVGPPASIK